MKLEYVFPHATAVALSLTGSLSRRDDKPADNDAAVVSAHWASGREGDSGLVWKAGLGRNFGGGWPCTATSRRAAPVREAAVACSEVSQIRKTGAGWGLVWHLRQAPAPYEGWLRAASS